MEDRATARKGEDDGDPRHVVTKPIMLHSDSVMVLHVYTLPPQKLEEWGRDLYLREFDPFHEILADSAKQMVAQLAPNACARFWFEVGKAIKAHLDENDAKYGSSHSPAFLQATNGSGSP